MGMKKGRVESSLLGLTSWWMLSSTQNEVIELLERNFLQDEILTALAFLNSCATITLPPRKQANATRSATRTQAEDLVKIMVNLNKEIRMPRITIHCEDLGQVSFLFSSSVIIGD